MELTHDERELLENYRSLGTETRKEVAERAAALAAKARGEEPRCQCPLPQKEEKRPEAAKEPLFTE
jgi:hypothetical protein